MMPPLQQNSTTKKVIAGSIAALIVIALIVSIAMYEKNSADTTTETTSTEGANSDPQTTTTTPETNSIPSSNAASSTYKDGTYTATSDYYVPHGSESIEVTLIVRDDVVTASTIVNSEGDPESARFQEDFTSEYKSNVVGKKIDSIQLSHVAGASDTTQGFNDALQQIMSKAQA